MKTYPQDLAEVSGDDVLAGVNILSKCHFAEKVITYTQFYLPMTYHLQVRIIQSLRNLPTFCFGWFYKIIFHVKGDK